METEVNEVKDDSEQEEFTPVKAECKSVEMMFPVVKLEEGSGQVETMKPPIENAVLGIQSWDADVKTKNPPEISTQQHCLEMGNCSSTGQFSQTEYPCVWYNDNVDKTNYTTSSKSTSGVLCDPLGSQQQGNSTQIYAEGKTISTEPDKSTNCATLKFLLCDTVNMPQVVHLEQEGSAVSVAGREQDSVQPVCYNYLVVNQVPLAATAASSAATYGCDVCGLLFTHIQLLNNHKLTHSRTNVNDSSQRPSGIKQEYSCDICGLSFNLAGELRSHKIWKHWKKTQITKEQHVHFKSCDSTQGKSLSKEEDKDVDEPIKEELSNCESCEDCQGSGVILLEHTNDGDGNHAFQCNICSKTFSRYTSLWNHKKLHSGAKPYKCEICGLEFAKSAYISNHMRVHTGEKPFKCEVCGMQFSQSPHLKNHVRIHSGEKPFECDVCKKTFARYSTLWNHRRIHTGDKPHCCNVCGLTFSQKTHLKTHAKTHSLGKCTNVASVTNSSHTNIS